MSEMGKLGGAGGGEWWEKTTGLENLTVTHISETLKWRLVKEARRPITLGNGGTASSIDTACEGAA